MYGYIRKKKNQYCIFHAITEKDKISLNSKEQNEHKLKNSTSS